MEEERKINENTGNMLKQALERRQTERLSSNFSYRMMSVFIRRLRSRRSGKRESVGQLC